MSETAELRIEPPQVTAALQYMSITVLEIAEWLVKQQQLLKQQQRLLEEKQRYGGNLTWRKQEYFIEYVLGVPICSW